MARSKFPNKSADRVESTTDFVEKIAAIDRRLLELDAERIKLLAEKERLSELVSTAGQPSTDKSENLTSNQKVENFKNLFVGRIDVYATRWEN